MSPSVTERGCAVITPSASGHQLHSMVQRVARRKRGLRLSSHPLIVERRQQQRHGGIDPVRRWQRQHIMDLQPVQRIVLHRGTRPPRQ